MIQQGQVFRLKSNRSDGAALWAYRYRIAGRGSKRVPAGRVQLRERRERGARA